MKRKKKVLIVEDHPIVRYGIKRILNSEPDLTVCGDVESAEQAIESLKTIMPDIMVVDISLKHTDGLQLTRIMRAKHPDLPILILSMHDERIYANKALRAGASGYVMKEESTEKLVSAIRNILKGDIYVSEDVKKNVLQTMAGKKNESNNTSITKLSDREYEIFLLIGTGLGCRAIARKLGVSIKTVETHRTRVKHKMGLDSSARLMLAAMEWAQRENLIPVLDDSLLRRKNAV